MTIDGSGWGPMMTPSSHVTGEVAIRFLNTNGCYVTEKKKFYSILLVLHSRQHHYDLPHNSRETHGSDENRDSGPNGAAMAAIRPRISPNSHFRGLLNQGRAMATAMRAPPLTPHERGALAKQLVQAREETKDLRHRCRAQEVALAAAADERVALEQAVEASATAQAELKDRLQQAEASRRDIGLQEEARTHELQAEVNALQEQLATSQTRLRLAQEDLEEATSEAQVLRRSLARVREESGQALERFDEELSALQQENDEREAALRQRAEEAEARLASQTTTLEIELAQRQDELQERTTEVEVVRARLAVEKERAETHLEAAATRLCTREGELVAKLAASEDRSERLLEQFQGQMAVAERRHQEQERKLYREIEEARVLHGQQQHDAAVAWDAERAELEVRISVLEDELAACTTAPSNPDQGDVMATAMAADSAQAERVRQLEAALANVSGESMEALAGIRKDMIVLRQLAIELQGFASLEVAATTLGNALVTNAGVEQPEDKANEETEVKKTAQVEAATEASLDTEVAVEEEPKKEAETEVGAEPTAEPKKVAENKAESASNRKSALQQAAPDTMHAVILRALQDVNVRHARALSEREVSGVDEGNAEYELGRA